MSDIYSDKLKLLAKRSNAEQMDSVSAFAQGFIMGRKYQREFTTQLHNNILREMHENSDHKFEQENWWDNKIIELEKENFELKSKYIWEQE